MGEGEVLGLVLGPAESTDRDNIRVEALMAQPEASRLYELADDVAGILESDGAGDEARGDSGGAPGRRKRRDRRQDRFGSSVQSKSAESAIDARRRNVFQMAVDMLAGRESRPRRKANGFAIGADRAEPLPALLDRCFGWSRASGMVDAPAHAHGCLGRKARIGAARADELGILPLMGDRA
jgi:hypothetical protein